VDRRGVTVERLISAPPAAIFELLADPGQHPRIDGSGSVKGPQIDNSERLTLGARFGMRMQAGLPYSMMNTVIEFEQDRRIAWQTTAPAPIGRLVGGRIWRYELIPAEGGTLVKETWDLSRDRQRPFLQLFGLPAKTKANMERTLERISTLLQTAADKPPTGA
jgi:uncharacterized protein YndB with AHSA1/START domain